MNYQEETPSGGAVTITPQWGTCHQVVGDVTSVTLNAPASVPSNSTMRSVVKFSGNPTLSVPSGWVWNSKFSMDANGCNELILAYDTMSGSVNIAGTYFKTL